MINQVILSGNVGKDPKVTNFQDGGCCVQFSLATTEKGFQTRDGRQIPDRTEWHNIVVNRNGLTTLASKYIHKGDKVTVVGELRYRTYQDSQGVQRSITEIYASTLDLCTPRQAQAPAPAPAPVSYPGGPQPGAQMQAPGQASPVYQGQSGNFVNDGGNVRPVEGTQVAEGTEKPEGDLPF